MDDDVSPARPPGRRRRRRRRAVVAQHCTHAAACTLWRVDSAAWSHQLARSLVVVVRSLYVCMEKIPVEGQVCSTRRLLVLGGGGDRHGMLSGRAGLVHMHAGRP
jgi:hypothetical protein